jgi:hypothetical protein
LLNALHTGSAPRIGLRSAFRFPPSSSTRPWRCYDPIANHELGAHEDERARAARDPALGFDKLADGNGVDEVHVKLDGHRQVRP